MSTHSTAPGCSLLTPIMRWWGAAGAGRRQDQPITHRCRYSGVFSCQPVRWFPPAQVLQYANMLAACDGCSAVCRLQVRNAMLQLGRWIIIIIGSGLFSHQACILQLRHSAHCSAATLSSGNHHPIHYYPFHIKTIPIKSLFWETSKISMFK